MRSVLNVPLPLRLSFHCLYGRAGLTAGRYHSDGKASRVEPHLHISDGQDMEQLRRNLEPLLHSRGGQWCLTADGKGMQRSFKFETFKRTWVSD